MWGDVREMSWKRMVKPKEEGGLGLRDPKIIHLGSAVKRVCRIWQAEDSLWADWMQDRYVKGRNLNEIVHNSKDSPISGSVFHARDVISTRLPILPAHELHPFFPSLAVGVRLPGEMCSVQMGG